MVEDIIPKISGTKLLFQNSILEKLTRTHIAVPVCIFFAYATSLLFWSIYNTSLAWEAMVILFFLGLMSWTLTEYCLHRFLFHRALGSRFQYTIHGVHHEFPKDKERLAMPPIVSIAIATSLLFLLNWLIGKSSFSFLAGFITGYALYLCVHYMIHTFPPPGNFLKVLWNNHNKHHYKNGKQLFGVSSPLWDYILGTAKS
jgi:sterol desaturase/sphingolipid hydroxylase (fatty acid hydroxylase superfamily)